MKRTKKGFISTIVGLSVSLINAIIQFLLIYWVLRIYGTEFNGFVRLTTAFSFVGGTTEGALGISTVILLIKPLANHDFISANEIFSTAKTRFRKGMIVKGILIALIAVLYPLEIMVGPTLFGSNGIPVFEMVLTYEGEPFFNMPFYQLMFIILFFGIKNLVMAGFFGVYENLIQADQQNGIRRLIILFSDVVIYGIIFAILNIRVSGLPLNPLVPFSILLLYSLLRGLLIMFYVKRNYPWLKYYKEFNNFQLRKMTGKMFWSSIGQAILFNSDIVIVVLLLGTYGLQTSSMLSLYLIVGLNTRLIMTNFITSFREYFVTVMVKEGRLEWKAYANYELYLYVVAAFTFVIMALVSPYLVNGLYGDSVRLNLENNETLTTFDKSALTQVRIFMFQQPLFSILYGLTTAFILIIQGQYTLIQAKGKVEQVSKWIDIIALIFLVVAAIFMLSFAFPTSDTDNMFLVKSLLSYYAVKVIFMFVTVIFLWFFNFSRGTYNSNSKYVFSNLLVLVIPMVAAILTTVFFLTPMFPVIKEVNGSLVSTFNTWNSLVSYLVLAILAALIIVGLTALAIRPKVAISLVLMLPGIKQIVDKTNKNSRYKRLRDESIDLSYYDNEDTLNYAFISLSYESSMEFSINTVINLDEIFKPKIYKIKNSGDDKKTSSKKPKKKA